MRELIKKVDDATLWTLVSDVAALMDQRGYTPDRCSNAFMFWYEVYKELEAEIDSRLVNNFMEV